MEYKRITIFSGHYGSGKTNLAVNFAFYLHGLNDKVAIADLDIVNPYFRTKDSEEILTAAGIRLITSDYANTNADVPSMPPAAKAVFDDKELYSVLDVGGDDRGALALGRYASLIKARDDCEMLMVINKYRPLSRDPQSIAQIRQEIENASHVRFAALVNNSNLGKETTAADVLDSLIFAEEASRLTGLPVRFTSAREDLCQELAGYVPDLLPLKIYVKADWRI